MDIAPTQLARIVRNAVRLAAPRHRRDRLLWGFMMDLTAYGSTSAVHFCHVIGLDPHQTLSVNNSHELVKLPEKDTAETLARRVKELEAEVELLKSNMHPPVDIRAAVRDIIQEANR